MKLAFVCTDKLPSPAIEGGAIQILIDGIAPIIGAEHELTIFSVSHRALPREEVRDGIRYVRFPKARYISGVAGALRRAKPAFDVVHVFNRPYNIPNYRSASPRSRFVVSLHNEMFHPEKISIPRGRWVVRAVEKILTVSDYMGSTVKVRFPQAAGKLKTVYSGVDLVAYHPPWTAEGAAVRQAMRQKYGCADKKVILFVGRLSNKKGPHILIKAFKELLAERDDLMLAIVGSKWFGDNTVDDYVRYLHRLSLPIKDKIIFTDFVKPVDIPHYYLLGDVFVCASQWQEPLARVHYEAMAAGAPIITTRRGGNAEVIDQGKTGIVLDDYRNPQAFADAIRSILSKPDKGLSMAKNARIIAEQNFGFQRVAQDLMAVYEETAKAPYRVMPPIPVERRNRRIKGKAPEGQKERKIASARISPKRLKAKPGRW